MLAHVPIRLRLTLVFAVAMAVVLAAMGLFLYLRLGVALDRTIEQSLRSRVANDSAPGRSIVHANPAASWSGKIAQMGNDGQKGA